MRIVVCDTGPVLHLSEAGALDLLERAGEVLIPATVDHEIARHIPDWPTRRPRWLRVDAIPQPGAPSEQWAAHLGLGAGEVEAIVLAKSRAADWLLTDDATARVVATLLGFGSPRIPRRGALGRGARPHQPTRSRRDPAAACQLVALDQSRDPRRGAARARRPAAVDEGGEENPAQPVPQECANGDRVIPPDQTRGAQADRSEAWFAAMDRAPMSRRAAEAVEKQVKNRSRRARRPR